MGEDPRRLFVGQLPSDILEDEILTVFNTYGRVEDVKVFEGKPASNGKCAFITYDTEQAANAAIQVLNESYKFRYDDEKPCTVKVARGRGGQKGGGRDHDEGGRGGSWGRNDRGDWRSERRDSEGGEEQKKVFVAGLPMDIVEDEVQTIFGTYGRVEDVRIVEGKPPGSQKCAFVVYETGAGAKAAVQVLHDVYKFRVDAERPIRVEFARSGRGGRADGGGRGDGDGGWDRRRDDGGRRDGDWDRRRDDGRRGEGREGWWGGREQGGRQAVGWEGGAPRQSGGDRCKVFVGNLPQDIHEDEVRTIFATYGRVAEVGIIDGKSGGGRCAFVTYDAERGAAVAIQVLHNVYRFRTTAREPIRVEYARGGGSQAGSERGWEGGGRGGQSSDRGRGGYSDDRGRGGQPDDRGRGGQPDDRDPRKVFVGQLPVDITEEEIRTVFKTYGGIRDIYIIDGKPAGTNKVAFVEFDGGDGAQRAIHALNDKYRFRHDSEKPIRLSIAQPKHSQPQAQGRSWGGGGGREYDRGYDRDRGQERSRRREDGPYDRPHDRRDDDRRGQGRGYDDHGRGDRSGAWDHGAARGPNPPGMKLHVGNLPPDIQREALETIFGTYGRLTDVHIMNRGGGDSCAAFVCYAEAQDARQCVAAMEQGYEIRPGQGNINVQFAKAREKGEGRGGGRDRPY